MFTRRSLTSLILLSILASLTRLAIGFSPNVHNLPLNSRKLRRHHLSQTEDDDIDWINLVPDRGVQKMIIEEGSGDIYPSGSVISIDYKGSIVASNWTVDEVLTCWLSEQQGLDYLAEKFQDLQVDGKKLNDLEYFTEDFVRDELGLQAKIASKKLVMAAKRLVKTTTDENEYPLPGSLFDSNEGYEVTLGKGKVIQGMEVGLMTMKRGEKAKIKIRSDYGYGGEGCRKRNGDILVPPFATICFEIKLK